jgi:hypothetical protein
MYHINPSKDPFITLDYILKKIGEERIFERYLCPVVFDEIICNPLRYDRHPTCRFFRGRNGLILFCDFSGFFFGSCFEVVKYKYNVNLRDAILIIAKDFKLLINSNIVDKVKLKKIKKIVDKENNEKILQVKRQVWTEVDKEYWKSFHLNSKILDNYQVSSCKIIWINDKIVYNYSEKDPAYVYYFGEDQYKVYFPLRDNYRFLSNTSCLQGWNQLPEKGEILIITKSLKDVMCLNLLGISAIAPQAESNFISIDRINLLKSRFSSIFTLFDFDRTGCRSAFRMWSEYQIPMLFLTNGKYNTIDYQAKDIAEYINRFGLEATKELIKDTYNKII